MTFHANCLLRRQFAWNVRVCLLEKNKKIIISLYIVCLICLVVKFKFLAQNASSLNPLTWNVLLYHNSLHRSISNSLVSFFQNCFSKQEWHRDSLAYIGTSSVTQVWPITLHFIHHPWDNSLTFLHPHELLMRASDWWSQYFHEKF